MTTRPHLSLKHRAFDLAFRAIVATGADRWGASLGRGLGAILMLHHVRPDARRGFAPNGILEITPEFLDRTLHLVSDLGFEIVSMDEAIARTISGQSERFFIALTYDDGYRDNVEHAWPVMAKHNAPWTMFVTPGFADRTAPLWWLVFEEAIRRLDRIEARWSNQIFTARTVTDTEKQLAFDQLYWRLRAGAEQDLLAAVEKLGKEAGIDAAAMTDALCLDWAQLKALAGAPGVTIGAHTMTHPMLAKHSADVARREIADSKSRLEQELGLPIRHLAYPVGDPGSAGQREFAMAAELGFVSAVTTRPGHVFAMHQRHLHTLPRVSLNGLHQNETALKAMLSGLPFLALNKGRRTNVS
ncbi:MAG: polysaccharide deacetylase family protein [Bosea sp. (in: a-proteobacteria)]